MSGVGRSVAYRELEREPKLETGQQRLGSPTGRLEDCVPVQAAETQECVSALNDKQKHRYPREISRNTHTHTSSH